MWTRICEEDLIVQRGFILLDEQYVKSSRIENLNRRRLNYADVTVRLRIPPTRCTLWYYIDSEHCFSRVRNEGPD